MMMMMMVMMMMMMMRMMRMKAKERCKALYLKSFEYLLICGDIIT